MATPLLVTGASGHLGRRVLEFLLDAKAGPLIATTRDPEKLADLRARGVTVRRADFDDPASLVDAFAGAERLLLISTDALDRPGRRLAQHLHAVKAAERAGVRHVVYTSLTNPGSESPILLAPDHRATEEALAASTLGYTVLRNNMYTEMLLGTLGRAIASGQLVAAAGQGAVGYVTREDCARAAAEALRSSFEGRRVLDVTGPALVSHAQLAALATELSGKRVEYVPVALEAIEAGMRQAGLPPPVASVYASFDEGIARGTLAVASEAVAGLTGREPQSVAAFLSAHRAEVLASH